MPNWCYNSLRITPSNKEQYDALVEELKKDEPRVFNHLHPMPEEYRETNAPNSNKEQADKLTEQYGYPDWYSWSVGEWGTKWEPTINSWEEDGETIWMSLDTAWAPPIELYEKLVSEGWGVYATYCEEGMAFVGEYEDGEDRYYEYGGMNADEIEQNIPQHLDEDYCLSENARQWEEDNQEDEEDDETV